MPILQLSFPEHRVEAVHRTGDDKADADVEHQDQAAGKDRARRTQRDDAVNVIGARVEGVALAHRIGHKRCQHDALIGLVGEEFAHLVKAEGRDVENQARAHDRAARETAAR